MRHHPLGRTGLFVSELCLGTMTFGGSEGMWAKIGELQQADAERLVGQAVDAGINFIDTADVYAGGVSEQITGQALKNLKVNRDSVVVATKVSGETGAGPNARGLTRSHILDGVKASLRRLQLDHIDLYQVHGFDPATPIEETLRALDQLVRHGHVRYIGVSGHWVKDVMLRILGEYAFDAVLFPVGLFNAAYDYSFLDSGLPFARSTEMAVHGMKIYGAGRGTQAGTSAPYQRRAIRQGTTHPATDA